MELKYIAYLILFYTGLAIVLCVYLFLFFMDLYRRGTWFSLQKKSNAPKVPLVTPPVDLNQPNMFGQTPLMGLVQHAKSVDMVERVLEKSDVNVADENGFTALMKAAEFNTNAAIMAALVSSGADVFATEYQKKRTALHIAACGNTNPDVIRVLLAAGSDVNAVDGKGKTPLMRAAQHNPNPAVINVLLEAGADKTLRSMSGKTAFDYAHENEEIYKTQSYYNLEV